MVDAEGMERAAVGEGGEQILAGRVALLVETDWLGVYTRSAGAGSSCSTSGRTRVVVVTSEVARSVAARVMTSWLSELAAARRALAETAGPL